MTVADSKELASRLCDDLVRRVAQRGDRTFIVTQFKYPDGDFINLYLENNGESLSISDLGDTVFKIRLNGVEVTEGRQKWIQTVCGIHGVMFEDSVFRKRIQLDRAGVDCLGFCQAIAKISTLEYEAETRLRSFLPAQLEELLHSRVESIRPIARNWTDDRVDPKQSYPVDYRLNGRGDPRQIFHVVSREKSTLVAAVSGFQKLQNIYVPTMSIVAPDLDLGLHHVDRLQRASTEIHFGLSGYEEDIVRFALSK